MDPVRITSLQIEHLKRIKAVHLEPSPSGLTVIGGRNRQGKTSVLDGIAWAVGGGKFAPSNPQNADAMSAPRIDLTLSNGIRVERSGKNAALKVTDPTGQRAGQALLDSFVSQFALDLPRFLNASPKDKANTLLQCLGIGDELARLDEDVKRLYNERHAIGQVADAKTKHASELPEYPDAPDEPVSVSLLIRNQQAILAKNGENQRKRDAVEAITRRFQSAQDEVIRLETALASAQEVVIALGNDLMTASKSAADLEDESTAEIEASLADIEAVNAKVGANQQKAKAGDEADQYRAQYDALSAKLDEVRARRLALLDDANLPLPGLSVEAGELVYRGQPWDCMSGAEQLMTAVAIVRRLNPSCGFVLMDRLEQMDLDSLREFGSWLHSEGLQVIATRVSTGDECSVVIEDGLPQGETYADVVTGIETETADNEVEW